VSEERDKGGEIVAVGRPKRLLKIQKVGLGDI